MEQAQPTDWHRSWGQTSDGKPKAGAGAGRCLRPIRAGPIRSRSRKRIPSTPKTNNGPARRCLCRRRSRWMPAPVKVAVVAQPAAPAQAPQALPSTVNRPVAVPAAKIVAIPAGSHSGAGAVRGLAHRRSVSLFRKADPCDACCKEVCECKPVASQVAPCPPCPPDALDQFKNAPTLLEAVTRPIRAHPSVAVSAAPPAATGMAGAAVPKRAWPRAQVRKAQRAEASRGPAGGREGSWLKRPGPGRMPVETAAADMIVGLTTDTSSRRLE